MSVSVILVYFTCCNLMHYFSPLFFSSPKIIVGETAVFCLQLATKDFENQEKTILTGDCCYINPLVRRTIRFLGMSKITAFIFSMVRVINYVLILTWGKYSDNYIIFTCSRNSVAVFLLGSKLSFLEVWIKKQLQKQQ